MAIVAEISTISPHMAQVLLGRNQINRKMRASTVHRYADTIKEGRWRLNGEAIVVSEDGSLLDGQHRLSAVVEASTPIRSILVTGVDASTFDTLDTGIVRTVADVIGITGAEKSNYLASGARALYILRKTGSTSAVRIGWDSQVAMEFIAHNPDLKEAVEYVTARKWKGMMTPGWLIALYVEFLRKDALSVADFFEVLSTGYAPTRDHPVLALRERLLEEASRNSGNAVKKLTVRDRVGLCIKAWNKLRGEGDASKKLTFRSRGKRKEEMPVIS